MSDKRTELEELGEFGLIERLAKDIKVVNESTKLGIGDDAAVIDSGDQYSLLSTDMLLEGVHFDLSYAPLQHLGYKAIAVNVSDTNVLLVDVVNASISNTTICPLPPSPPGIL